MEKMVYSEHRSALMNKIDNNSIVILFAGNAPKKTGDEVYQFTPDRNFYYLTGISEENHIVVLSKFNNEISEKLFLKEIDLAKEMWNGKTLRDFEAKEISGIEDTVYMNEFYGYLNRLIKGAEEINLYLDLDRQNYCEEDSNGNKFAEVFKGKYPQVIIKNVSSNITPLRMIKSKSEIAEMQRAIDITIDGVESLMKNAKAGMKEYELEAYFDFVCKTNGAKDFAFRTIAAAGKNATTLHYVENNSEIKNDDLILFDLGAQWNFYNADITRTFPVGGKFTDRQKQVYEAVLRVNKAVIEKIKPGVVYKELNAWATDLIAEECIKLGIIKEKKDVSKYYWHSIGHNLGLDTHDVEPQGRNFVFEEGMVFTVEPGIYISEESIGIRIEDDVLVTADGCEVLTKGMMKEVSEIEAFMKR
ncbi:aminopeptidase P family protein [Clostridium butyricum]|jgi:Xaa-Pro aminopeptidase|uniref:aminopeptidase P family protein n=1 Tax=Clostridium butyricum TaxID=1492 RepID=UPI000411C6ED|nr:aminopeptidase P family protein [Clostridium butyricum]MBS5984403.1 aminopeptidase P family protein [Clostridium butyricum]MDB2153299.1 aminopeptidase P family protein [Clostridium butyricum]MDU1005770.1 aminopeptidase P family protein [Clostridium butyricum]MDU5722315.1 aminopeptidase P family protein [Clostridium butyricum]MDU5819062.1 aminopeptidase P family protein [Clostridium butyricum]